MRLPSHCLQVSSRVEQRLEELAREMRTEPRSVGREKRPDQRAAMSDELQEVTLPFTHWLWSLNPTPPCWHPHVLTHSKRMPKKKNLELTRRHLDTMEGCGQDKKEHNNTFTWFTYQGQHIDPHQYDVNVSNFICSPWAGKAKIARHYFPESKVTFSDCFFCPTSSPRNPKTLNLPP